MERRTHILLVVRAGGRSRLVGGNLPAGTPVEAAVGNNHRARHNIDRWLQGAGLFGAGWCTTVDCAEDGEKIP